MTTLRFSDGVRFETDGPYRVEWRKDGYYVVGNGLLCAVDSRSDGENLIQSLEKTKSKPG